MKASELIAVLARAVEEHGDRDVLCTWEGITPAIYSIYIAKKDRALQLDGEMLLDCDGGAYQERFAAVDVWKAIT